MKEDAINNYTGTIDRNENCPRYIRKCGYLTHIAKAQRLDLYQS